MPFACAFRCSRLSRPCWRSRASSKSLRVEPLVSCPAVSSTLKSRSMRSSAGPSPCSRAPSCAAPSEAAPARARAHGGSRRAARCRPRRCDTVRPRPRRSATARDRYWCGESRGRPRPRTYRTSSSAATSRLPTRQRRSGSFSHALKRFFCAALPEVHPEFQDDRAIVGECAFEGGDLVEEDVEFGVGDAASDAIADRRRIPRAQKERDAAVRRQIAPVAPQARTFELLLRRIHVAASDDPVRIHPLVEQAGGFALAGGIDAGKQHDDRKRRAGATAAARREARRAGPGPAPCKCPSRVFSRPRPPRTSVGHGTTPNSQRPTANHSQLRTPTTSQLDVVGSWKWLGVGRW